MTSDSLLEVGDIVFRSDGLWMEKLVVDKIVNFYALCGNIKLIRNVSGLGNIEPSKSYKQNHPDHAFEFGFPSTIQIFERNCILEKIKRFNFNTLPMAKLEKINDIISR